jgi:uncharacterized protein involved in exopolysaccharide biosynthesis
MIGRESGRAGGAVGTGSPGVVIALALLRHLRLLIAAPIILTVLVIGFVLVRGRSYTAESVIAPDRSAGAAARLAGFAAQLGLGGVLGAPDEPVQFYGAVVESRELLRQVAEAEYTTTRGFLRQDTVRGTLIDIWRIEADTREEELAAAVERLREYVEAIADIQAGVLRIRTTARPAGLAEQINRQILAYLNEFNIDKRQTQAEQERVFIEGRLEVARAELEAAETELAAFYEANRSYQNSPRLAFEAGRLERRVQIRQEVYRTLAQAYEEARIQEVRNTPVLTIVDPPEGSALPAIRLRLLAMLVLPLSTLIVVALVLVLEYLREEQAGEILRLAEAVAGSGNRPGALLVAKLARKLLRADGGAWHAAGVEAQGSRMAEGEAAAQTGDRAAVSRTAADGR